jgi:hypothetical protein
MQHRAVSLLSALSNTGNSIRSYIVAFDLFSSGVHCELKYQHWPMWRTLVDQKFASGVLYPYNSNKTYAKKSEISTQIDVYSYSMTHRHASCSAGVICIGRGVLTYNIQPSV